MRHGRRAGVATVVAALTGLCLLAGCSSSHGAANSGTHRTSTTSIPATTSPVPTTRPSTTTSSSAASVVLSVYRADWSAFEHALADANPSDAQLAATMVDPQLQGVKANLFSDQRQGIVGRGSFTLPKITALSAASATVVGLRIQHG